MTLQKIKTFLKSLWFHVWSGFPKSTQEEIKEGSENWIEDAKDWAEDAGADSRIGFVIPKITAENGATGFAFIEVVGSSWEGLRIFIRDIFATEKDARKWVEEIGVVI